MKLHELYHCLAMARYERNYARNEMKMGAFNSAHDSYARAKRWLRKARKVKVNSNANRPLHSESTSTF